MRIKEVMENNDVTVDQAVLSNMNDWIHSRKMRNGKISVDALKGIVKEAKVFVNSYIIKRRKKGQDVSGIATRLGTLIEGFEAKHLPQAEYIKDYRR